MPQFLSYLDFRTNDSHPSLPFDQCMDVHDFCLYPAQLYVPEGVGLFQEGSYVRVRLGVCAGAGSPILIVLPYHCDVQGVDMGQPALLCSKTFQSLVTHRGCKRVCMITDVGGSRISKIRQGLDMLLNRVVHARTERLGML